MVLARRTGASNATKCIPASVSIILSFSHKTYTFINRLRVFGFELWGYGNVPPDEKQMYGFSKSLGEVNNTKDLTLRMSYIGPEISEHASGLLDWFLITVWVNNQWMAKSF